MVCPDDLLSPLRRDATRTERADAMLFPEFTYSAPESNDLAYGRSLDTSGDNATGDRR